MASIQIKTQGIKKSLKRYNEITAIGEYIWNGFDAQASCVQIAYTLNTLGTISEIKIIDNGYGIPKDKLKDKFVPFFESEKEIDPNEERLTSAVHGKNGMGRLTFFHFASEARWETVYEDSGKKYTYDITVKDMNLEDYFDSGIKETKNEVGTIVHFDILLEPLKLETIIQYLKQEFGWFLELNKEKNFSIKLNGEYLDYSDIIADKEDFNIENTKTEATFDVRFIQWSVSMNNEYSRYYLINSDNKEVNKRTTKLNNKGDCFYHSIYIKSKFFDNWKEQEQKVMEGQVCAIDDPCKDEDYKFMIQEINKYLRKKRKPFLKQYTDKLIFDLEEKEAFPKYGNNPWDKMRKDGLENVVREIYQVEPKIFVKLNREQKKTFVRLLDLVLDVGEVDRLFEILSEIVELDTSEREELADILKVSKLSNVIKTIKIIQDRYKAIDMLRSLVFDKELHANERDHIQKFIEKHYWIFGEQYNLVTAAEPKFEEALRRYIYLLKGENKPVKIDHPDKDKEMDIFMVRQDMNNNTVKNIVVELKHPHSVKLGEKELQQVKKYMRVILSQDEFNDLHTKWEFYLVGNNFDSSGYIEGEIENVKHKGEKSLVYENNNCKIYVKTWSEIFNEFELRHTFLNRQLELERERLQNSAKSAKEIVDNLDNNSAVQAPELKIVSP